MKIHYDLLEEKKGFDKLLKTKDIMGVYDKLGFVEFVWNNLKLDEEVLIKIDEYNSSYPNILGEIPPRIIIKIDKGKQNIIEFLKSFHQKKGVDLKVEQKNDEFFLKIKKNKEEPLDFGLKLDKDNTINLSKLFDDIKGVRTYYNKKKK